MSAGLLKSLREAATLMLVTTRKKSLNLCGIKSPESCTDEQQTTDCSAEDELEVLVIKRDEKACSPDLYVFPGGSADNSDFSREWLQLYRASNPEAAAFNFAKPIACSAPMFSRERAPELSCVPSEVAFRICAIRETFEESGVLLARSIDVGALGHNPCPVEAYTACNNHESMVQVWRERVQRDPSEFLNLCKTLDVVPDIWSMYDWSNWLTPMEGTVITGSETPDGKRFDSAFFISCLKKRPYVAEGACQTVRAQWASPFHMIKDYNAKRVMLAPPQLYEASRLVNFSNVEELLCFLTKRAGQPIEKWMPVRIQCADAILYTFPGDSLYPAKLDQDPSLLYRKETLKELTFSSCKLHRAILTTGSQQFQLVCNIEPPLGHVVPRV